MKLPAKVYWRYFTRLQKRGTMPTIKQKALMAEHQCLNCGMDYVGNFCPCCGQPAGTERFTIKQTLKHLLFIFTKFDDKFKHTIINLCYRPGYMIREYIAGHRVSYMRPIPLLFCLVTVYALSTYFFLPQVEPERIVSIIQEDSGHATSFIIDSNPFLRACLNLIERGKNNMIVFTLSFFLFPTFASRIIFRKTEVGRDFNLAEHFYALTYVACLNMTVGFLLLPFRILYNGSIDRTYITFLILWWVYWQLFQLKKAKALFMTL